MPLGKVTAAALVKWKKGLAASLKSTARARIVNDFKAALNRAIRLHEAPESRASLIVKNGLAATADPAPRNTDQRENQILSDDDIRKLISTAKEDSEGRDFYFLVLLLAATGARFSQLTRILVRDVQLDKARVLVPVSHKGSTTKSVEFTAVPLGNDILDALRPIIEGRPSTATLLERWRLRQVSQFAWERVDRGPWKTPSEMLRNWNAIVKRCGIERCVPYALHRFVAWTLRSLQIAAAPEPVVLAVSLRRVNGPFGQLGAHRMFGVPRLGRQRCSLYERRPRKPDNRSRLPGSELTSPVRTLRERTARDRMRVCEFVPENRMSAKRSARPRGLQSRG